MTMYLLIVPSRQVIISKRGFHVTATKKHVSMFQFSQKKKGLVSICLCFQTLELLMHILTDGKQFVKRHENGLAYTLALKALS